MTQYTVDSSAEVLVDLENKRLIRILHVDDDAGILKITKQCLEMDGALLVDTALSVEEALTKLAKEKYDVVVSDYQMSEKNGLEFLNALREKGNAIPFIMLTGKGKEEIAIKALNLGADQYLSKIGNPETVYFELAHSIRKTVKARENELCLNQITESMLDIVVLTNLQGNILYASPSHKRVLGYKPEELLNKCLIDWVHPGDVEKIREVARKFQESPSETRIEVRVRHADGHYLWLEIIGSPVTDHQKRVTGVVMNSRDITAHKKAELEFQESEKKYGELTDQLPEIVYEIDDKGRLTFISKEGFKATGYSREDFEKGLNILQMVAGEYRDKAEENIQRTLKGEKIGYNEYTVVKKDGSTFPAIMFGTPIVREGKIVGLRGIVADITERKKAEQELRRFSTAVRTSLDGIITGDLNGNITDVNDAALRMYGGTDKSDLIGKNVLDFIVESDRARALQDSMESMKTEQGKTVEYKALTKNGTEIPVEITTAFLKEEQGKPIGFVDIIRNIAERKKAEQSVKESEEKFKNLSEQSPNMIFINKKGRVVYANKKAEETMGYAKEEFYSPDFNFLTLHAPKSAELVKTNFAKHMHGEDTAPLEIRLVTKQGRVIDAAMATKLIDYEGEQAILGTIIEMTDQRKAEKAIQESEKKFQALFSGNPESTVYTDPSMHILDINPRFFSLFGYSLDEVKGKHLIDVVVPKGLVEEGRMLDKKAVEGYVYHDTVRMRKDGFLIPVSVSAAPIFIQGRLVGYIGVYKDISQQTEALAQFKALFMGNPEAAAYLGSDFCIKDVNPRFEELFGYSLAEIKGKHINETVVPKEKMEEGKALDERAGGGYVYFDTFRMRKDGSLVPVSVSAAPILVEDSLVGHVAMYKDISELKNAESAMKEMMQKIVVMNEKLRVVGGLTRHDVKNKLSIITGNTYLNKERLTDRREVIESFGDVESATDAIVRILDFARDYERLGVEELTYVDVQDAIEKAFSFFSDLRGVKIANESHGLTVFADSMLTQLFYNLIDNSLKYGQKITQIKIHYEKGQEGQLRLVYEDDGVGISKDPRSKIFSEGYSTGKGSGYGLYLIKKMMEVYGWTILETGEPGKGAQFTIIIPETSQNGKENYLIT